MRKLYLWLFIAASFSACKKNTDLPNVSTFFGRFNGFIASISTQTPGVGLATYMALNVPTSPTQSNGTYTSTLSSKTFSMSFTKSALSFAGNGVPSASAFQSFFGTGAVPYIDSANANGIALTYVDINGIFWNSALGDQTGSTFTITQSQPSGNNMLIESLFNCKLYDGNGDVILLTGGMFTGQFKPQ